MKKNGYLLIADISGYTDFIRLHNLRKKPLLGNTIANMYESHAEKVVSDLLEAVIDAIEPTLQLNKLEGDAALFFCSSRNKRFESDEILKAMDRAQEAFKNKASELVFVQACGCEPCSQSKNLKLKIIAHKGDFTIQKIRNFEELAGENVILIHRLLKNGIKSNEYWLVTEEFSETLSQGQKERFSETIQTIESFGRVKLGVIQFSSPEPSNKKIESRSKLRNFITQASYFMKPSMERILFKK